MNYIIALLLLVSCMRILSGFPNHSPLLNMAEIITVLTDLSRSLFIAMVWDSKLSTAEDAHKKLRSRHTYFNKISSVGCPQAFFRFFVNSNSNTYLITEKPMQFLELSGSFKIFYNIDRSLRAHWLVENACFIRV